MKLRFLSLMFACLTAAPLSMPAAPEKTAGATPRHSGKASPHTFGGIWAGAVSIRCPDQTYRSRYTIRVSPDEKTVWVRHEKKERRPDSEWHFESPARREGDMLKWQYRLPSFQWVTSATLQFRGSGAAVLTETTKYTGGHFKGITCRTSGTLSRSSSRGIP